MNDFEVFAPPTRCDVCTSPRVELTTNRDAHGPKAHDPDALIYRCMNKNCRASVGVTEGTKNPTGLMSDPYLNSLRVKAHLTFDPLWQFGKLSRTKAYKLLQEALNLSADECHIGKLSKEQLRSVIEFAKSCISEEAAYQRRKQDKKYERKLQRDERNARFEIYKRSKRRFV